MTTALELIPLGGLGEFGMNMMVVACGETAILVDAGVMFPEPDLLGVDLIIPDLRQLERYRIQALVLTHGHEDHIGAVPHVVSHFEGPIYGTKLTLALLEPKLEKHGADVKGRLHEVAPRDRVQVGSFSIEFLRVTHSMPDCVAVAIHTPAGTVLVGSGELIARARRIRQCLNEFRPIPTPIPPTIQIYFEGVRDRVN